MALLLDINYRCLTLLRQARGWVMKAKSLGRRKSTFSKGQFEKKVSGFLFTRSAVALKRYLKFKNRSY